MFLDNLHIWIICRQSVFEHRKIYVFVVKAPRGALVFPLPGNLHVRLLGSSLPGGTNTWRAALTHMSKHPLQTDVF
jgi:hypothetical protein